MTARRRIVLDCDPGHDDVVAILVAADLADLLAVTTVSGNAPIDQTTHNALVALTTFGIDVPVHRGAEVPLLAAPTHFPQIHGTSGLAGPELPEPTAGPAPTTAVECLLSMARSVEDLWVVATGPLTNVALAIRADDSFAQRLGGISIMGGGLEFGNVTPGAEYNIWADPQAAAIVFSSGIPLLLCPLDVTHQVLVDRSTIDRVRSVRSHSAAFVAELLEYFIQAYADVFFDEALGPLHDPCAVLALTNPELFDFRELHIEIALDGVARGVTIADRRDVKEAARPNARVAVGADRDGLIELVVSAVAHVAPR